MTIKAGIIGMGFIGISHIEAIRRLGFGEVVAVADNNLELAQKRAADYGIPRCCATAEELIADPEIDVIHNCTPNHLHLEINRQIIAAGKHVFSEKPLAMTSQESSELLAMLRARPQLVHAVNFLYRMNPLPLEMKQKIRQGALGRVKLIHGSYLQDWLLYDTDYNWRIEPAAAGPSRCIADIGSHWMDLAQTVTGLRITAVCADLGRMHDVRRKPQGQIETFSHNTNTQFEDVPVETEDFGSVLLRFENGAQGMFITSEVSAGRKCHLAIEIDGTEAAYAWNQETADRMWMGRRNDHNLDIFRNPNLFDPANRGYTHLAAGHPEGWNDAMRNNVQAVYRYIQNGSQIGRDPTDFATFADGHQLVRLTEAILNSNESRQWIQIDEEV